MRSVTVIFSSLVVITIIGVIIVMSLAPDWATRGLVGDSFGLLNALYSGLAFAGLLYAILLQRQDLALQREELTLTRTELAKAAIAQESSAKAQRDLAKLNAYTALLNCKNAEISEALTTFHATSRPDTKKTYGERYCELLQERWAIEARIENVLLLMGGQAGITKSSDTSELLEKLMKTGEPPHPESEEG